MAFGTDINKKGKVIIMAEDYSKSMDTQIQELQEKDKGSYKIGCLGTILFFLGTAVLILVAIIYPNPIMQRVAVIWGIFWLVLIIVSAVKAGKDDENLRSLMAKKIGIEDILNQYLQVEIFDPERAVDDKIVKAAGIYSEGYGKNYIKGTVNGCTIETSYVTMKSHDVADTGYYHWYTGQLSCLKNKCCFSEKLLLVRKGDYRKYGMGTSYYNGLPKMLGEPAESLVDLFRERDREQYRITITAGPLESQWEVFATDPEMARRLLDPHTELYRRLLDAPRLAFVYYCDDSIYFGGNYCFDLTKGTPEEVRAKVEEAMDGLIKEGVGTVLSAEYPAEGE